MRSEENGSRDCGVIMPSQSQGLGEQLKKIRDMIPGGAAEEGGVKKEKAKGKGGRGEMARLQTALVSATMPDEVRAMAAQVGAPMNSVHSMAERAIIRTWVLQRRNVTP